MNQQENEMYQIQRYRGRQGLEQQKINSVKSLQSYFRSYQLMKMQRKSFLKLRNATIIIQQHFRCYKLARRIRQNYVTLKRVTIFTQRLHRANLLMRKQRTSYAKLRTSVISVQRRYRAKLAMIIDRNTYQRQRSAAIFCQRKYRAKRLMLEQRDVYMLQRDTSLLFQNHYRAKSQRSEYLRIRNAIKTIAHRFIAFKLMERKRTRYQQMRKAAIIIQTIYRAHLLMKNERANYLKFRESVIQIQTRYRGKILMRRQYTKYLTLRRCTINIQKWFRATMLMRRIFKQYKLTKYLIVCMQRRFRAKLATKIERENFLRIRSAVILLQHKYRDRKQKEKMEAMILHFQARTRGYLVRREFKQKFSLEVKLLNYQIRCVKKIQAYWRGFIVRKKKGKRSMAMKNIRNNLRQISNNISPEKQMKNVLRNYVAELKSRCKVRKALNILCALTRISRVVPQLLVTDSIFFANFCYQLMSQTTRSEMDKMVVEQCSYIILNMARYELTKENTFQIEGLSTVVQMLLRWCDKESEIFNALCSVIYVFSHCPRMNEKIRNFLTNPDGDFSVYEIKRLILRKERMQKSKGSSIVHPKYQLPIIKPDFGMKSNMFYIFNNSTFAFHTILAKLQIDA